MRRKHVAVGRGVLRFDFRKVRQAVEASRRGQADSRHREALRRDPGTRALQVPGRRRTASHRRFRRRQRLHQGHHWRGLQRQGFSDLGGTVLAALALAEFKKYDSQAETKRNVVAAIESVSKQLGNTPAICRKCYIHPEILNAYMSGDLVKMIEAKIAQKVQAPVCQAQFRRDHGAVISPQASRYFEGSRLASDTSLRTPASSSMLPSTTQMGGALDDRTGRSFKSRCLARW